MDKTEEKVDKLEETETSEEIEKKGKSKKGKKDKPKKEKKSSKKIKVVLILILLILIIAGTALFIVPMILMGKIPLLKEETYQTGFLVKYDKNLIYNKYDINVTFNDSAIKTMGQGENYGYIDDLELGTYILTFSDVNDANNKVAAVLNVNESEDYPVYKIKADWKGLTISVDSTSKSEILKYSDEVIEEASSEEVVVEEEPSEETTETEVSE